MSRFPSPIAPLVVLVSLAVAVSGCAAVEGIFKAGVWVGILAVLLIAGVVAVTTGMFRR
ncbi:MAG TPA: hypothetical protein VF881_21505 [Polyangiaceae bacterium]